MKTPDTKYYLLQEEYEEAVETIKIYATSLLFSFAKHSAELRDIIIRNFIARGTILLQGILALWKLDDYQDGWILYRSLLDRLFHIKALADENVFQDFDDWCFVKQYDHRNRIRSDPIFTASINKEFFRDTSEEKERYQELKIRGVKWKRPHPEKIAKNMELEFLYKHGYDYASMHVHPMSDDGMGDFLRLTGLEVNNEPIDQRALLSDSCLVLTLLIQEGLNASTLEWRAVVYFFLEHFRELLDTGSKEYGATFIKVAMLMKNNDLCRNK